MLFTVSPASGQSADPSTTLSDHLLLAVIQLLKKEGHSILSYFVSVPSQDMNFHRLMSLSCLLLLTATFNNILLITWNSVLPV
jgi:hypothetical protein